MTTRKDQIIEDGYEAVVTDDRVAHKTDSDCWNADDHLIPLKNLEEAEAHGYTLCEECAGA